MSLEVVQFPLELEYKKHSNIVPADIQRLRDWLLTQPHMPHTYITDLELILAYHSCNCSMEVTKQLLDLHYTFKTHSVIFKDNKINQSTIESMKTVLIQPLKEPTYDGSAALYFSLIHDNTQYFNLYEIVRTMAMVLSLWQYEDGSWPGLHLVVDMQHVSLAHMQKFDLTSLRQMSYFTQEALLLKLKRVHMLNAPSFLDKLMFIITPFLKKEVLDLIIIHQTGHRSLEQYFPAAVLPVDSGGEGLNMTEAANYMIQKLQDNATFFNLDMKKRVDESVRPGKPKTLTDIFGGVEGSFKNLEID